MGGREVFVTNVERPDTARRKFANVGNEKPIPTDTYRLLRISRFSGVKLSEAQTATPA